VIRRDPIYFAIFSKVLFTVEIIPEEVQRTCMEASLLHNLQSPNVVQLFGIAVLPPSLCVVLEVRAPRLRIKTILI
jgi:hypothetical protein